MPPTVAAPTVAVVQPTVAPDITGSPVVTGDVTTIGGIIVDASGAPIWDATILSGTNFARTAEDGTFSLANVPTGSDVRVWASGYADQTVPSTATMNVQMEREDIKAVYLTGAHLTDEQTIQSIIDLATTTEVNAVVIDIKEGTVYYDTGVQFHERRCRFRGLRSGRAGATVQGRGDLHHRAHRGLQRPHRGGKPARPGHPDDRWAGLVKQWRRLGESV